MSRFVHALVLVFIASAFVLAGCGGSDQPVTTAGEPSGAPAAAPSAEEPMAEPAEAEPPEAAGAGPEEGAEEQERPRFVRTVRGTATIGILPPATKVVGSDVVTTLTIKNLSEDAIALLRVDETWYDRSGKAMPGATERYRKPLLPGEIIEMELRTPKNAAFFQNNFQFTHAGGLSSGQPGRVDVKPFKTKAELEKAGPPSTQ